MVSVREAGMHEKGFRDAFIGGKTGEQGRQIDLPFSEKALNITSGQLRTGNFFGYARR